MAVSIFTSITLRITLALSFLLLLQLNSTCELSNSQYSNHTLDLFITSSDTYSAQSLSTSHLSPSSDHFSVFTKQSIELFPHNISFFLPTPFHRLLSLWSHIYSTYSYNRPSKKSLGCLTTPLLHLGLKTCQIFQKKLNLIPGSLLLSAPSDKLFVMLKTAGNTLTLLVTGFLWNLFVTNSINWISLPKTARLLLSLFS